MITLSLQPSQLDSATPSEIDADLFLIMQEQGRIRQLRAVEVDRLHSRFDTKTWHRPSGSSRWTKTSEQVLEEARQSTDQRVIGTISSYDEYGAMLEGLFQLRQPYEDEYVRRGGWTRAFLVDNADGHVHSSMGCSTCHPTTQFHWVTELSGHSEQEIVEQAGERACTVCYPSAPVDVLKQPSRIEGPAQKTAREAKQQRDEEKRQRDVAKAEKAIANSDGSPLRTRYGIVSTVVTAWREVVSNVVSEVAYGYERRNTENTAIIAALAAKLGQTEAQIQDAVRTKAVAKLKREGYGDRADRITTYSF